MFQCRWKGSVIAISLLMCLSLWLATQTSSADVLYKKNGAKLKGEIIEENNDFVKIKVFGAIYQVPREDIFKIEKSHDIRSQYQARVKTINRLDDQGWVKLGYWCQDNDLLPESIDCFYNAISANPEEKNARFELGHRKYRGQWVTSREYYRAKGYVRYQGVWVTKEDKEKYEAGFVKDQGSWITLEEYRKRVKAGDSKPKTENPLRKRRGERNPASFAGGAVKAPKQGTPETPEQRKERVAQIKASGGWQRVCLSKYYDFYSNGPAAELKNYAYAMDRACITFKKIFGYKPKIVRPFPIYMCADQAEFKRMTGRKDGAIGLYYYEGKIVSFHHKEALSTLFHEGAHQFQHLALGRNMWSARQWFIEGLATYFEGAKLRSKDIDTSPIPKGCLAHLKRAIRSRRYAKLKTLIRLEQKEFGALHYAQAWSLIYFLVNGTKGGKKRFIQYFRGVKQGVDGEKLFEECFDKPIEVIEKAWLEYVKHMRA